MNSCRIRNPKQNGLEKDTASKSCRIDGCLSTESQESQISRNRSSDELLAVCPLLMCICSFTNCQSIISESRTPHSKEKASQTTYNDSLSHLTILAPHRARPHLSHLNIIGSHRTYQSSKEIDICSQSLVRKAELSLEITNPEKIPAAWVD